MKTALVVICAAAIGVLPAMSQRAEHEPLAQRIRHTDLSKVPEAHSHGSNGFRKCQQLVPATDLDVNLRFINRCQMMPGGGVAEHFHNTVEEMFTILNGSAEFTVDGRTSLVKGPAGAPQRLGHAHAVFNPTNEPVDYLNIDVTMVKGHYDAFNLADSRDKNVALDAIPQFMVMRLDKSLLHPMSNYLGGKGTVYYARSLNGEDVFLTNWAYVDHLLIPPGASEGLHYHRGLEEVYYVLNGNGQVQLNDETAPIQTGDAVPIRFNEAHSFTNNSSKDLDLLIIGVSAQKNVLDTELGMPPHRR